MLAAVVPSRDQSENCLIALRIDEGSWEGAIKLYLRRVHRVLRGFYHQANFKISANSIQGPSHTQTQGKPSCYYEICLGTEYSATQPQAAHIYLQSLVNLKCETNNTRNGSKAQHAWWLPVTMATKEHLQPPVTNVLTVGEVTIGYRRYQGKGEGKAIPLQTWTGPEGSRRLRLPDLKTIRT